MKVTIVYESMFGNTHEVAEAIAQGIRDERANAEVWCVPVAEATLKLLESTSLLVVGGPTHIRGMTSERSRKMGISAEEKIEANGGIKHEVEPDAEVWGLRDWFDSLPGTDGRHAAAFDTRLGSPMAGGAARGIGRRLRKHGYVLVADPEGFVVDGSYGPLKAGEAERAKRWGTHLVASLVAGSV